MDAIKRHFRQFLICWNVTYIVMTAWLFEAVTGRLMAETIVTNLVFALILYPVGLLLAFLWRTRGWGARAMTHLAAGMARAERERRMRDVA